VKGNQAHIIHSVLLSSDPNTYRFTGEKGTDKLRMLPLYRLIHLRLESLKKSHAAFFHDLLGDKVRGEPVRIALV
jgi:hypothetical protein